MKALNTSFLNEGYADVTETVFDNMVTFTVTLRSKHGVITVDVQAAEPGCQPFVDISGVTVTELGKFREFAANRRVQHVIFQ